MTSMNKRALRVAAFILGNLTAMVLVGNAAPPLIEPAGPNPYTNECHTPFVEPGVWMSGAPVAIAAGVAHSLALKADGSIVSWGVNYAGQTNVPVYLTRAVAVAANGSYNLALTDGGAVVGWGDGTYGETNIPPGATHDVVAIAAGGYHGLALKADGSIVGWGANASGQINVPETATNVVAIAAGGLHSLALRRDGSVIGWGFNYFGQTDVPPSATHIVAIAAGASHSLALRADGRVVTWGYNDQWNQLSVPARATNVVAIAARDLFSLALRADGSVVVWGRDDKGKVTVIPATVTNVVGIAAGGESFNDFCLALKADGSVVGWGENDWGQATAPSGLTRLDLPCTVTGDLNTGAVGTYTLTYTATNILGEGGVTTRTVVVVDTTPPVVVCPTNMVVEQMDTDGATVAFSANATDLCSGTVLVSCDPPSGSKFALGTNIVVCGAVDDFGNRGQCSFTITVLGLRDVKNQVLAEMMGSRTNETRHVSLLSGAIGSLERSLAINWWIDEAHLAARDGKKVFIAEAQAVLALNLLMRVETKSIPQAVLQGWVTRLVGVDRRLATIQIEQARRNGATQSQLAEAMRGLAAGDLAVRRKNYPAAILHYANAWQRAMHVTGRLP